MSNFIFEQVDANGRTGFVPRLQNRKPRIVLHTTEMVSPTPEAMRKAYANHNYPPHVWCSFSESNSKNYKKKWGSAVPTGKVREGYDLICQRLPFDRSAYALLAPKLKKDTLDRDGKTYPKGYKIETNHVSPACLQVEIEGWAGSVSQWEDSIYEKIGKQVVAPMARWIRDNVDPNFLLIPFKSKVEAGNAYGIYAEDKNGKVKSGSQRMSYEDWLNRAGGEHGDWTLCAHANTPMNRHWDAPFDLARVAKYANDELSLGRTVYTDPEETLDAVRHYANLIIGEVAKFEDKVRKTHG